MREKTRREERAATATGGADEEGNGKKKGVRRNMTDYAGRRWRWNGRGWEGNAKHCVG